MSMTTCSRVSIGYNESESWSYTTYKDPGAIIGDCKLQAIPDGVIAFFLGHPVTLHTQDRDCSLVFRKKPSATPGRRMWKVREHKPGDHTRNKRCNAFDEEQPAPARQTSCAVKASKDARCNKTGECCCEYQTRVQHCSSFGQLPFSIPATKQEEYSWKERRFGNSKKKPDGDEVREILRGSGRCRDTGPYTDPESKIDRGPDASNDHIRRQLHEHVSETCQCMD